MIKRIATIAAFALIALSGTAQEVFDMNLYNGRAPKNNGLPNDTAKLRIYLPQREKATGRAIIICPGGGYDHLAIDKEGYQWGEYFQSRGIAAAVLKYRMPNGHSEVPMTDAEQAIKLMRLNAASWHIDQNNIGIMGFSAGGHLAATVATLSKGEAKPNFQILFYPVITMMEGYTHEGSRKNLLGTYPSKREERKFSCDMNVTRATPRAFIALSDDDNAVPPANGVNYYLELYRNDVPASLFVYPTGGHGWGARMTFRHHLEMIQNLNSWLDSF